MLGRDVTSLASLTAEEAALTRSFAYGQLGPANRDGGRVSAYLVVPGETTGLVRALQALPVSGSRDSVNVQLRKLAQTEAGRETVRRFADRAVALLTAEPTRRICPGDPVAAQARAQEAQDWQASFEAGVDVQTRAVARTAGAAAGGVQRRALRQASELTCRLLQDVR